MKLTFLGTGAGRPTNERNVSALALEFDQDNKCYLFDCGEATQHQIMKSRLSIAKIDTIFITHLHGDHYYGLPGILATKKLDGALKPLSLYGPKGIKKYLECVMDLSKESLGYVLSIIEFKVEETYVFDRFTLKVLPLIHSIESHAFYIKESDIENRLDEKRLREIGLEPSPLYGELKKGKSIMFQGKRVDPKEFMLEPIVGRSLIIAGDNSTPAILGEYLADLDLLVHESTYSQKVYDVLSTKYLHTTAKELGITAQEKGVKNLIANHISSRYSKESKLTVETIYDEIKHDYKGGLFVANDLDVYYLGRDDIVERIS